MSNLIRRLVSGNKTRFKDESLNLELDLVYLTDQVVIMGYPAEGIEGLYRNRREDVKKFLTDRHGKNFWVFNFCPIRENSYDESLFDGRVSRYPFPDHHAPPLAIMPLVAREMRAWLSGSRDRVAVLHCKAGKGRSGTMACTYLLSEDSVPSAPQLKRSYTSKEWAKLRAENVMSVIPNDTESDSNSGLSTPGVQIEDISSSPKIVKHYPDTLETILDLHTSRRMNRSSSPHEKQKQGVSIASQRRWLYYWTLLLSHSAPSHMWEVLPAPKSEVLLTQITLRLRPTSAVKVGLARALSIVLERANGAKNATDAGEAHVWASLARYNDEMVEALEEWERSSRDEGGRMGVRRPRSDFEGGDELANVFKGGRWDKEKMVKVFARMGVVGDHAVKRQNVVGEEIHVHSLSPLANQRRNTQNKPEAHDRLVVNNVKFTSDTSSSYVVSQSSREPERGVVLDADREVRVKLYMGQVFIAWLWLVPAFHMTPASEGSTKFLLTRKELDFPLGLGSSIIDVELEMEWLFSRDGQEGPPPLFTQPKDVAEAMAA